MSTNGSTAAEANGTHPDPPSARPGIADLGSFRGRADGAGPPVLPPAWRPTIEVPSTEAEPASRGLRTVVPTAPPAVVPVGGRSPAVTTAPDARVVLRPSPIDPEVRVIRKVRPWSVWKLSLAFAVCMVAVVATAGAILWAVAVSLGVLDNVEGFVEGLGFEGFAFDGASMLRAFVIGGLLTAVSVSFLTGVLAIMFNLLSDLTGGLEAEVGPRPPSRRAARRAQRRSRPAQARKVGAATAAPAVIDLTDDPELTSS